MALLEEAFGALRLALGGDLPDLPPCPCCGRDLTARVDAVGVDGLTAGDLDHYVLRAPSEWGDAAAYAVLLPRLLALTATPAALTARGLSWRRHADALAEARFDTWPEPAREAVLAFSGTLWEATCAGEVPAYDALEVLYLVTRFSPGVARSLLDASFQDRRARAVRRALVAEISLKEGRIDGWFEADPARLAAIEAAQASGALPDEQAARRKVHPAEPAVRIWFCDPWRGVELSEEAASARGADQSMWRRRMARWKQAIEG